MLGAHHKFAVIVALTACGSRVGSSPANVPACSHTPLKKVADDVACVVELRLREGSTAPIQVEVIFDDDLATLRAAARRPGFPLGGLVPDTRIVQTGLSAAQIRALIELDQVTSVRFPVPANIQ